MMKRKANIERRRASGRAAFEREPFEGARSFGMALSRRLCFPSGRSLPSSRRASRALALVRQITARHAQQGGARTLEFLRSYFGGKYEVVEGQGLTGTRIYKKPGGTILESSYKLSLNFQLLLNLARSVETLNLRFMGQHLTRLQSFTALTNSLSEHTALAKLPSERASLMRLLSERTHAQGPVSAAPVLLRPLTEFVRRDSLTRREVQERLRVIESSARVSNILTAQGRTSAGRGYARTLHAAATQADHFNFALFPQRFHQSFRQTRLYVPSYFGGKYEVVEGQGAAGAGMQSTPGESIQDRPQESSYKLSLNFQLLLNLARSAETLNLRFMGQHLTRLPSFTALMTLARKDASPMNSASGNRSRMSRWSERASLMRLLSERTHAQGPVSAAPVLVRRLIEFVRRDSLTRREVQESVRARESSTRVSYFLAMREASLFMNRLNVRAGRGTNGSAEAERNVLTALHSMATQVSSINTTLSWQSLASAPRRGIVSLNVAQTDRQHHFRRGGNLHTALAFNTQSRAAGRVLIRQQNFLRSLSSNAFTPLVQEAAPPAHDFKQTPASLFLSERYTMGLTGAPSQPPVLRGETSFALPLRPALLFLTAQRTLQREILQRREHWRQRGFANVWNITTRNSLTLMPVAARGLARSTMARAPVPAAPGRSFSWPGVHETLAREKLTHEKLARESLLLEAYALKTRTPEKRTVKVGPLSPAAQFVTGGMKKMVIAHTRARLAGPGMISAHTGAAMSAGAIINTGAFINVRLRPSAAMRPGSSGPFTLNPEPFTLNLARGGWRVGGIEPVPAPLLGKVDTLRLTPPVYVYAQPVRSTLEDQRVITHIDHKEVTRIVQREVQSARAGEMDVARFSCADYAQIADQVYSTLVRRLIVEKERLGLC